MKFMKYSPSLCANAIVCMGSRVCACACVCEETLCCVVNMGQTSFDLLMLGTGSGLY